MRREKLGSGDQKQMIYNDIHYKLCAEIEALFKLKGAPIDSVYGKYRDSKDMTHSAINANIQNYLSELQCFKKNANATQVERTAMRNEFLSSFNNAVRFKNEVNQGQKTAATNTLPNIMSFQVLKSSCPACSDDKETRTWTHHNCGGAIEINNKGRLRCSFHKYSEDSIVNCQFTCGNHVGVFKEPSLWGLAYAISVMSTVASRSDREFENLLLMTLKYELIPAFTIK